MIDAQLSKDADPRAVSQSDLSERRRLRRRDDVAAPVRQAGEAADAGRERAHRRARASAGRRCRRGPISTARSPAATSCSRACARRGSSPPAQEAGGEARAPAHSSLPRRSQDARAGYAKEYLRQRFRDEFGGDHPPDWDVRTTFVPELQDDRPSGRSRTACAASASRELQAALVALDPRDRRHPGAGRRPRLPAVAVQPRGAQPAAARLGVQAAALRRGARARLLAGVGARRAGEHRAAGTRGVVAAQRQRRDARRADAARRAARVEQPRRDAAAAAGRLASGAAAGVATSGCEDLPDVPSLSLGTGLVTPLELTAAFATFPNGGLVGAAARHPARRRRRRRRGVRGRRGRASG